MKIKAEWSKSYPIKPRDNLEGHEHIKGVKFIPSYENDDCPVPMNLLIGWEYARIWQKERDKFVSARELRTKPKRIKNDYEKWISKRKRTSSKKTC